MYCCRVSKLSSLLGTFHLAFHEARNESFMSDVRDVRICARTSSFSALISPFNFESTADLRRAR